MSAGAPIRVVGISGSLRAGSYNTALIRAAAELAPDGMTIELCDISQIPIYNDDVREAGFPPPVAAFRETLRAADGVLLSSPEYNRSISGVIKNAIDWASRAPDQPFAGKPVAIMGASRGALGAAFANHHMRQVLVFLDARMINGPEVMVGGAPGKFDDQGRLTDQAARDVVAGHLTKLARAVADARAAAKG